MTLCAAVAFPMERCTRLSAFNVEHSKLLRVSAARRVQGDHGMSCLSFDSWHQIPRRRCAPERTVHCCAVHHAVSSQHADGQGGVLTSAGCIFPWLSGVANGFGDTDSGSCCIRCKLSRVWQQKVLCIPSSSCCCCMSALE